jgi:hypothetical protein
LLAPSVEDEHRSNGARKPKDKLRIVRSQMWLKETL